LSVLRELHAEGHTIILVTHDAKVAAHTERIVTLADGAIVADRRFRFHSPLGCHRPATIRNETVGIKRQSWNLYSQRWGRFAPIVCEAV